MSRALWASTANIVRRLTQHTLLATAVNLLTVFDLIAERETTTRQHAEQLREQIAGADR
ncbi:hypothetical protein ACWD69_17515 [Micromonospora chokoriensis]